MVTFGPASVVVIPFPFSDLSASKLRPAVVLADTGNGDWLLCQITSNQYRDAGAIRLTDSELREGALLKVSYVRPMKLFTAYEGLITKRVAVLNDATFSAVLTATIDGLTASLPEARAADHNNDFPRQDT